MMLNKTLAQRFKFFVNKNPAPNACWLWMGGTQEDGYGRFSVNGERKPATHVAFFLATGQWPKDKMLHKCDNPPCVRYEHLFEGTLKDNTDDMIAKGRSKNVGLKGEQHPNAKLTWQRVHWIRDQYAKGLLNTVELAEICKVDNTQISRVIRYDTWKI